MEAKYTFDLLSLLSSISDLSNQTVLRFNRRAGHFPTKSIKMKSPFPLFKTTWPWSDYFSTTVPQQLQAAFVASPNFKKLLKNAN